MKPDIERFLDEVEGDGALQARLSGRATSREDLASAAAEMGRARGLDFTAGEFSAAFEGAAVSAGELGADALERVTGGVSAKVWIGRIWAKVASTGGDDSGGSSGGGSSG
jgi:hypothetical protein